MNTEDQDRAIRKVSQILQAIRGHIDRGVSLEVAQAFLVVAENEGASPGELADKAGATRSGMSRHLLNMSEKLRDGSEGYRLLQRVHDPMDMRSVRYTLSPKGRLLKNTLVSILKD